MSTVIYDVNEIFLPCGSLKKLEGFYKVIMVYFYLKVNCHIKNNKNNNLSFPSSANFRHFPGALTCMHAYVALCDADTEDAKETKLFLTLWNIHILEQTAEQAGVLQATCWEGPEVNRVQGLRIKYSWVFYRKKT